VVIATGCQPDSFSVGENNVAFSVLVVAEFGYVIADGGGDTGGVEDGKVVAGVCGVYAPEF